MRILITVDPELPVPPRTYGGIERIVDGLFGSSGFAATRSVWLPTLIRHVGPTPFILGLERIPNHIDSLRNMRVLRNAAAAFRPHVLHSFSRILYILPLMRSALPKIMSLRARTHTANRISRRGTLNGSLSFTGCSEYICRRGRRAGGDVARHS